MILLSGAELSIHPTTAGLPPPPTEACLAPVKEALGLAAQNSVEVLPTHWASPAACIRQARTRVFLGPASEEWWGVYRNGPGCLRQRYRLRCDKSEEDGLASQSASGVWQE